MPSERIQRQIDRLLDEAEEAYGRGELESANDTAHRALALDPDNEDARSFVNAVERIKMRQDDRESPTPDIQTPLTEPSSIPVAVAQPSVFANGRYAVTRFLGEGGKKRVYLAQDTLLDRDVAFALIKTEGLDDVARTRISREAQAMGRLGSHPHIVTVFDLGDHEGQPFMVTELMQGGDVEGVIEDAPEHRLPLEQAIRIAMETCRGLEFAHSRGIIHRDLKPGNVWLTEDGTAKIGDFGLAVATDRSRLTQEGMMVGTVSYMPPEQAMGGEVTAVADLYSLGAMLYEMVAGRPPFLGDDSVAIIGQHINTPPVAPTWHRPECPRSLEALILRLLAKNPAERPESASDVLMALQGIDLAAAPATTDSDETEANALDSLAGGVFVGRQAEMGALKASLEDALSGRGRMVTLVGQPGIGKTRTSEELATYAVLRGCQVLWGRCHESAGAPPYWPWIQVIRSHVRERDPDQLRSEMGAGAADIAEVVSDVRDRLPGLHAPPPLDNPEQARFRLFDSITAFLKNSSRSQPLVIILDNLHWADRPSLLLLEFIASELANSRLLIIGTYRDVDLTRQHPLTETLAQLTRERLFERVLLRGLTQDDVGRFIEVTSGITPPRGLVQLVHAQTEGNPLFVTEVVRLLVQEGQLTPERAKQQSSWSIRIPEGVREVIGQRLNRLSDRCNQTLTIASVIGREFESRQLRPLVDDMSDERLIEVLEEALAARVIEESPRAAGHYQFTHALIRQTLLDELSTTRRVQMHARIADVLEELYADEVEAHSMVLAYHYGEAEIAVGQEKLLRYSLIAGERALETFAYEDAIDQFQRAMSAKEGRPMDADTAAIMFGLGRANIAMISWDEALEYLHQAFDYYETNDVAKAVAIAEYPYPALFASRMPDLISRALRLVEADPQRTGNLLSTYGMALALGKGDYEEAQKAFDDALAIAQQENDRSLEVRTLANAANINGFNLQWQNAFANGKRAVQLAQPGDHPVHQMRANLWAALAAVLSIGDLNEAKEHADAVLQIAESTRDRWWLARAIEPNALITRLSGDWETARNFTDRGLSTAPQDTGLLVNRILLEYEAGEFQSGSEFQKLLLGDTLNAPAALTGVHALLIAVVGLIAGDTGKFDDAGRVAQEVLSTPSLAPVAELEARLALALMAAQQNEARVAREQYAALAPSGGGMTPMISIDRALGLVATSIDELDDAKSHFENALAFCEKSGYRPELAWTNCNYADALLTRDDSGDHQRAMKLLDDALAMSTELDMRPLMERVLSRRDILNA